MKKGKLKENEIEVSLQTSNNNKIVSDIEALGGHFTNAELYRGNRDNHKFIVGQRLRLIGLEDYPEFNGEEIEITSIREDGPHGKAYYFKTDNSALATQLNWTYEYRLEKL